MFLQTVYPIVPVGNPIPPGGLISKPIPLDPSSMLTALLDFAAGCSQVEVEIRRDEIRCYGGVGGSARYFTAAENTNAFAAFRALINIFGPRGNRIFRIPSTELSDRDFIHRVFNAILIQMRWHGAGDIDTRAIVRRIIRESIAFAETIPDSNDIDGAHDWLIAVAA